MDNKLIIVDEQNNEYEYELVLTFDFNNQEYAIATNDNENYYVFKYDEETKNIEVVEDEYVLDQAQELLDTLIQPGEEDEKDKE